MLKLNINIEEDEELRSYIKNLIKGQVTSIARSELKTIISDVFGEEIKRGVSPEKVAEKMITEQLKKNYFNQWQGGSDKVEKLIKDQVTEFLKNKFDLHKVL